MAFGYSCRWAVSIALVSGLMHACWIIRMDSVEQLLCHFEPDVQRALDISTMRCR